MSARQLRKVILAAAPAIAFAASPAVEACTGIMLRNADNTTAHGRTVEFGVKIDISIVAVKIGSLDLKPLGQGSGMLGIPGDFTPPSRFVRAAVYSATAVPSSNSQEGIKQVFHILNNFAFRSALRPRGMTARSDTTTPCSRSRATRTTCATIGRHTTIRPSA